MGTNVSRSMTTARRPGFIVCAAVAFLAPASAHASGYSPDPYLWMGAVPPIVELSAVAVFLLVRKHVEHSSFARALAWLIPCVLGLGAISIGVAYRFFGLLLVTYLPAHLILFGIALSLPPPGIRANRWALIVLSASMLPIAVPLIVLPDVIAELGNARSP